MGQVEKTKVVVLSGAGISAESGLGTFRDSGGLWEKYDLRTVATPEGWARNPELVLEFYNARRQQAAAAEPNLAHRALARLQEHFEVVIVTQNVDDLHERAGSTQVIHLHGKLREAKSSVEPIEVRDIGDRDILIGDLCKHGSQLRPNIVWFGEMIENFDLAKKHVREAGHFLVVGTSLQVFPAAGLATLSPNTADKVLVALDIDLEPRGFSIREGKATQEVPAIIDTWLAGKRLSGPRYSV